MDKAPACVILLVQLKPAFKSRAKIFLGGHWRKALKKLTTCILNKLVAALKLNKGCMPELKAIAFNPGEGTATAIQVGPKEAYNKCVKMLAQLPT